MTRARISASSGDKDSKSSNCLRPSAGGTTSKRQGPYSTLLSLHRTLGNQAVQRLLRSGVLQAKMKIGQPGDIYEQESDRVAEQVMRMPEPMVQRTCAPCPTGGSPCPDCKDESEELVQRKTEEVSDTSGVSVSDNFIQNIGPGQPLDPATRAFFEPRLGQDLSQVRVHTDTRAAESALAVNASAYTVGQDLVFSEGQYAPGAERGRRLLAHELTHVVQQGRAGHSLHIQRACGQPAIAVAVGTRSGCTDLFDRTFVSGFPPFRFKKGCDEFEPGRDAALIGFAAGIPATATLEIHGFASVDGPPGFNRNLGCARALAARKLLTDPPALGGAGITASRITGIINHGPVPGPAADRRSVVIRTTIPTPPPTPTPSEHPPEEVRICGPDVSAEVTRVWSRIQSDFNSWGFFRKEEACRNLIQPIVYRRGFVINKDAFDTLGLYQGSADWLRQSPYHPPCATPGTCAPTSSNPFDPCHEDPNTCSNTVKVGSDCWLSGTPNYGTYGIMMRLCWDWTLPLILLPPWNIYHEAFSLPSTILIVEAYKRLQGDNPVPPRRWAVATWLGGPGARVSGGNRPRCSPTCTVSYPNGTAIGFGSRFDYVWEPVKPR